jgi:hypothetical protein
LGDAFDLSVARQTFQYGDNIRIKMVDLPNDRTSTMLMAKEFEELARAFEVDEASKPIVDFLNGILFLTYSDRKPLRSNGIHEREHDGKWGSGIVFGSVDFQMKALMSVIVSTESEVVPSQMRWMMGAIRDPVANEVLTYLRGEPDWFELYKVHETIKAQNDKFTETAQAARHSEQWCRQKGIRKHMSLEEARTHVRGLVRSWLDSRFP